MVVFVVQTSEALAVSVAQKEKVLVVYVFPAQECEETTRPWVTLAEEWLEQKVG